MKTKRILISVLSIAFILCSIIIQPLTTFAVKTVAGVTLSEEIIDTSSCEPGEFLLCAKYYKEFSNGIWTVEVDDGFRDVLEVSDGYILVGTYTPHCCGMMFHKTMIAKYSKTNGEELWNRSFNSTIFGSGGYITAATHGDLIYTIGTVRELSMGPLGNYFVASGDYEHDDEDAINVNVIPNGCGSSHAGEGGPIGDPLPCEYNEYLLIKFNSANGGIEMVKNYSIENFPYFDPNTFPVPTGNEVFEIMIGDCMPTVLLIGNRLYDLNGNELIPTDLADGCVVPPDPDPQPKPKCKNPGPNGECAPDTGTFSIATSGCIGAIALGLTATIILPKKKHAGRR
ncbi:hypothetical protein FWF74_03695 [Candidatus Saccharibacteria bacterium]|nr:hypothetical protein [Candidatus Saccharibacteria bacterium]MCL1962878.1 hypothetical protein [Candidatus Saccharibacteria bacterium]